MGQKINYIAYGILRASLMKDDSQPIIVLNSNLENSIAQDLFSSVVLHQ